MRKFHSKGLTMLSVLFILAITSLMVVVINEMAKYDNEITATQNLDNINANKIALLGAQFAINETNYNSNFASDYTSGVPAISNYSILNGTLDITYTGDLDNGPLAILVVARYANSTRSITINLYKVPQRRMLLIEPTSDSQFNARLSALENLGWDVTTVLENDITGPSDNIFARNWNMLYIPSGISFNIQNLSTLATPIVTEILQNTGNLGLLTSNISPSNTTTDALLTLPTSQTDTPGNATTVSSSNFNFKYVNNSDIASSAVLEFTNNNFSALEQSQRSVMFWVAQNSTLGDGVTLAPQARIALNMEPNVTYPWTLLNANGLSLLSNLIEHVGCSSTSCFAFEIRDIAFH